MSLQDIVNVTIASESSQVTQAGFGTPLIFGPALPFGSGDRVRTYTSVKAMSLDGFGPATDPEYLLAQVLCSQNPRPPVFKVGRRSAQSPQPVPINSDLDAIVQADGDWYCLLSVFNNRDDIVGMAAWTEANERLYIAAVADAAVVGGGSNGDEASTLLQSSIARTALIYHPDPRAYPDAAWAGSCLPLDPGSETWKFRQLAGVAVTKLTDTQIANARRKNCNTYLPVGGLNITAEGIVSAGEYIDVVRGRDWLKARLQEDVFSLLANSRKVPFTDPGVGRIKARVLARLRNAVGVGFLAGDPAPTVSAPLVADVPQTARAARHLPDVQFTGTLAGAIHSLDISGVISV